MILYCFHEYFLFFGYQNNYPTPTDDVNKPRINRQDQASIAFVKNLESLGKSADHAV